MYFEEILAYNTHILGHGFFFILHLQILPLMSSKKFDEYFCAILQASFPFISYFTICFCECPFCYLLIASRYEQFVLVCYPVISKKEKVVIEYERRGALHRAVGPGTEASCTGVCAVQICGTHWETQYSLEARREAPCYRCSSTEGTRRRNISFSFICQ